MGAAFSGPTAALVHFTCTSHAPVNTWGWGWGWGGGLNGPPGTLRLARRFVIIRGRSVAAVPSGIPPGHANRGKLHLEERGSIPRRDEGGRIRRPGTRCRPLARPTSTRTRILPWSTVASYVVIYRDQLDAQRAPEEISREGNGPFLSDRAVYRIQAPQPGVRGPTTSMGPCR